MLAALKIENFALIDQLDLALQPGLNVLTGETGAGKSILLDAIDAVLGGKATGRWVRTGSERASVEAAFDLAGSTAARVGQWLRDQDIPLTKGYLTCRRELTTSKSTLRSRFWLNGTVVKRPQMESLRALLIEITAQGQTLQLGDPNLQRDWLDGFGDRNLLEKRGQVAEDYELATAAKKLLDARRRAEQQRNEQLEMFEFQSKELTEAQLADPDELEALQVEHQRLSHSVELQQQSYQVYQMLYENDGGYACADMLGQAENILSDMLRFDPAVESILEMVGDALAQVQEAGRQINAYGEAIETDPARLDEIDRRIAQLRQLCRKYNRDLPDLIEYYQSIQDALASLHGDGQSVEDLAADYQQKQQALLESCAQLTELRQEAALKLEQSLISQLKPLAMERVKFKVAIESQPPTVHGADQVTFLFSPNPGEPLQPLVEIASGGEMSRFLLALKACFSQVDPIGTLVFDEIDVGVSGRVAQAIAEKLYHLGRHHQVLCVTHQPLVAAMADAHYHVGKHVVVPGKRSGAKKAGSRKGQSETAATAQPMESSVGRSAERTIVKVTPLDPEARRDELAQLAGGRSHSEAIAFADSLLLQAESIRKAG